MAANPAVWQKDDGQGPVTEADIAVDLMLSDLLREARPDYGWLSEEIADDTARLSMRRVFIIDPIDGTRAFVDGGASWAHSLAVAEHGVVTAGVVFMPARDRLYVATRGGGAKLNGHPITARKRRQLAGAQVLATRASLDVSRWPRGVPPVERHFRPSLAYRMCLVAEGRFDAMLTFRPTWEWDIAAGALIAAEAGARVTDQAGRPLRFNTPAALADGVVAAPGGLHARLLPGA